MRIDVDSRLLNWLEYNEVERRLRLGLRSEEVYDFLQVPPEVYQRLLATDSKGRYFNEHIRNRFPYRRLRHSAAT